MGVMLHIGCIVYFWPTFLQRAVNIFRVIRNTQETAITWTGWALDKSPWEYV